MGKRKRKIEEPFNGLDVAFLIPAVQRKLTEWAATRKLAQVAHQCGLVKPRLYELHSGKRIINAYYIRRLVQGEVMTEEELLGGKKISELTPEQRRTVRAVTLSPKIMDLILEAESRGVNVETALKGILDSMASTK